MKLTIIIPNYNGARFLPGCLNSLRAQTYTDYSVIVVDNGSCDDSLSLLETAYPEVRILRSSRNCGFSAAANAGIARASTPYVMLLNNDTRLECGCLEQLVCAVERHPHVFSVGAHILRMDAPSLTDTCGDYYSLFGYAFCRGQGLPASLAQNCEVFTNCACATVYRTAPLRRLGGFDPRFFAYLEDVDLGFRARRTGLRSISCSSARVLHHGSGTTGAHYTPFKVYHSARNNILLRRKNLTHFQRLVHAPFFAAGALCKYFYFRRRGLHDSYIWGLRHGLRTSVEGCSGFTSFLRTEPWILYGTYLYVRQFLRRKFRK